MSIFPTNWQGEKIDISQLAARSQSNLTEGSQSPLRMIAISERAACASHRLLRAAAACGTTTTLTEPVGGTPNEPGCCH
jgi:hypothetical protein